MTYTQQLANMHGNWSGTSQLWLRPTESAHESNTTAQVRQLAQGQFIAVAYDWQFDGQPQDGLIIFRSTSDTPPAMSLFIDSWHMKNEIMICEGTIDDQGLVSLLGSYPAPPGPDWGWRIEIESIDRANLAIRMINIAPDGQETLAVLANYRRVVDTP
jgi:hypothetical protein